MISNDIQKAIDDSIEKSKISKNSFGSFLATTLEDRVGDPLWRSFILFFITYNWKFFAALFLGKTDEPQIRVNIAYYYLKNNALCDSFLPLYQYLIIPIALSILYFFYCALFKPFIVGRYAKFQRWAKNQEIENSKDNFEKELNNKINKLTEINAKLNSRMIAYNYIIENEKFKYRVIDVNDDIGYYDRTAKIYKIIQDLSFDLYAKIPKKYYPLSPKIYQIGDKITDNNKNYKVVKKFPDFGIETMVVEEIKDKETNNDKL